MKHYLTQPADPCEQTHTDKEIDEINDEIDEYLEAQEEEKRLNEE